MENKTFKKDGKVYYAEPDIEVLVNGVRKIGPDATFDWCCENIELADVIEREVYPQYHVGKHGEEVSGSYSSPLIVVTKERLSAVKDTRYIPRNYGPYYTADDQE